MRALCCQTLLQCLRHWPLSPPLTSPLKGRHCYPGITTRESDSPLSSIPSVMQHCDGEAGQHTQVIASLPRPSSCSTCCSTPRPAKCQMFFPSHSIKSDTALNSKELKWVLVRVNDINHKSPEGWFVMKTFPSPERYVSHWSGGHSSHPGLWWPALGLRQFW